MATDKPARRVLADEVVLLLAERPPTSIREIPKSRLFDARRLPAETVAELLAAVGRGLALTREELRLPPDTDLPSHLQPLATLLTAWVAQQSRDLAIEGALLATRTDIEAFLRGVPGNRLQRGWRADLIGSTVGRVVAGTAAVAYDGDSHLVLVDVDDQGWRRRNST